MSGLSPEQHAIRLPCVPASEIAGFLGFSPYGSPLDWWELHFGLREFDGDPELVETGLDMEDGIARGCARDLKWGKMERSKTIVDDWRCATPDRLFHVKQRGLQIKNHGPHMARHSYHGSPGDRGEWGNNLVPKEYLIQVMWEMIVVRNAFGWKTDRWCLGAYFGGKNRRSYIIRWDPVLAKNLLVAGERFWRLHIKDGPTNPPEDAPWIVGPEKYDKRVNKIATDDLMDAPIPTFGT